MTAGAGEVPGEVLDGAQEIAPGGEGDGDAQAGELGQAVDDVDVGGPGHGHDQAVGTGEGHGQGLHLQGHGSGQEGGCVGVDVARGGVHEAHAQLLGHAHGDRPFGGGAGAHQGGRHGHPLLAPEPVGLGHTGFVDHPVGSHDVQQAAHGRLPR